VGHDDAVVDRVGRREHAFAGAAMLREDAPAINATTPFAAASGRRAVSCVGYFG
jgi:hypothetical protein